MKFKSILINALVILGLPSAILAQLPNYISNNGLVGWYPFNGNANDESGNGNNGIEINALPTQDRFQNSVSAYSFDGNGDFISMGDVSAYNFTSSFSFSYWIKRQNSLNNTFTRIIDKGIQGLGGGYSFDINTNSKLRVNGFSGFQYSLSSINESQWIHIAYVFNASSSISYIYINGILDATSSISSFPTATSSSFWIGGASPANNLPAGEWFIGTIDDIGIWNRALTQIEITTLYNAVNCANNTAINPQTNSLLTGSTALFTATTSDSNPSYVWQSDLGQGYVTLNNFGKYSGVTTASLNIANVQLSEHNQPIRVISTSGNCIDTSNVSAINILDTCITNITVYDTLLTTVTDTLIINSLITGLNPTNNQNTLKVFPNPANTHLTIDYGNFSSMSGYTLKIVNAIGQSVFTTIINQQSSYIDLSTWTGSGIYYVQLIDTQNNTIENRKIVLQ